MKKNIVKLLLIALSIVMVVSSVNVVAMADVITGMTPATITVTGLADNGDLSGTGAKHLQLIKASDTNPTGWVFVDAPNGTIAAAFKTAYGESEDNTSAADYCDVIMRRVIDDYEGDKPGAGSAGNEAAASGAKNASMKLKNALDIIAASASSDSSLTLSGNVFTTGNTSEAAGVYLITAVDSNNNNVAYNNMAAYVSFGYSSGNVSRLNNATVVAKKITNTIEKSIADSDRSISIGDTANYTVTGLYPYFAGRIAGSEGYEEGAMYWLSDSSSQLAFNPDSITVKILAAGVTDPTNETGAITVYADNDSDAPAGSIKYHKVMDANNAGFKVYLLDGQATTAGKGADVYSTVDATAYNAGTNLPAYVSADSATGETAATTWLSGRLVKITYSAEVIALANDGTTVNEAKITTSPDNGTKTWETISKVTTDTYETFILKEDEGTNKLAGAHFEATITTIDGVAPANSTVVWFHKTADGTYTFLHPDLYTSANTTAWASDANYTQSPEVSAAAGDDYGKLMINGLDHDIIIKFKETVAPAGYTLNTDFEFTPSSTKSTEVIVQSISGGVEMTTKTTTVTSSGTHGVVGVGDGTESDTQNVTGADAICHDTKISALPSTGGIGTYIFTFVGVAVMAAAVVFFLGHKKVEA